VRPRLHQAVVATIVFGGFAYVASALYLRDARDYLTHIAPRELTEEVAPELDIPLSGLTPTGVPNSVERLDQPQLGLRVTTERSTYTYQLQSLAIPLKPHGFYLVEFQGRLIRGGMGVGVLSSDRKRWLGMRCFAQASTGPAALSVPFFSGTDRAGFLVVTNCLRAPGQSVFEISSVRWRGPTSLRVTVATYVRYRWVQILLLFAGLSVVVTSWWLLGFSRGREWLADLRERLAAQRKLIPVAVQSWPTVKEVAAVLLLAALLTTVDIHFSQQLGLLAYPPPYDGITYMLGAKSTFYRLAQGGLHSNAWVDLLAGNNKATLWQALMLFSFRSLGEGEWQAYSVRFWPTFLLLLLLLWVVRRRGGSRMGWVAVVFTAVLPTISVGLRSSAFEYFSGGVPIRFAWYVADPRPDLLFAVLLLWTVVPLVEHVHSPDRRTWLVSGAAAGLAVLTKPSTAPVLLLASGLVIAYVLVVNRRRFLATVFAGSWSLLPFGILVIPWAWAGGVNWVLSYVSNTLTTYRVLYSNPQPTFLSEATYYWKSLPLHMGPVEGWALLGAGLVTISAFAWRKVEPRDHRLLAYVCLSLVLYGVVSSTPARNIFLGLPYYLLLWLFSWAAVAALVKSWSNRHASRTWIPVLVSSLYVSTVVFAGFYALHNWPTEKRQTEHGNLEVTRQISRDLRTILTDGDTFMWAPGPSYPNSLLYYMVDAQGRFPSDFRLDPVTGPPPAEFVRDDLIHCKAILVYDEDMEKVAQTLTWDVHPLARPYFRAIAEWVRRPDSPYRVARVYHLSNWTSPDTRFRVGHTNRRDLAVRLYVRQPESGVADENCLAPDCLDTELSVFMQRLRVQGAAGELR